MRSGEVKIPGGKLVRVTLQGDEVRGWHATIDGDFFMEANAGSVLGVRNPQSTRICRNCR